MRSHSTEAAAERFSPPDISPASAGEARRRAIEGAGPEPVAAVLPCCTTCRQYVGVDRPIVTAA
ncbi:hypothetical protein [Streptomyces sp. NPDC006132]|uniref:hypothetical protein n=1 Tax=Streptomyces sp. NPDC006132 TaxID=3156732 RepID=UPI0033FD8ECE